MKKNKSLKVIYNDKYSTKILDKPFECDLEITQGDIFDIVMVKDSIKNIISLGEISEFLIKELFEKFNLKKNTIWIEDFSTVNDTKNPGENLRLLQFTIDKDKNVSIDNYEDTTYEKYTNLISLKVGKKL